MLSVAADVDASSVEEVHVEGRLLPLVADVRAADPSRHCVHGVLHAEPRELPRCERERGERRFPPLVVVRARPTHHSHSTSERVAVVGENRLLQKGKARLPGGIRFVGSRAPRLLFRQCGKQGRVRASWNSIFTVEGVVVNGSRIHSGI